MKYTFTVFLMGMFLFPFATFAQSTPSNDQILELIASITQQIQQLQAELNVQTNVAALTKDMNAALVAENNDEKNNDEMASLADQTRAATDEQQILQSHISTTTETHEPVQGTPVYLPGEYPNNPTRANFVAPPACGGSSAALLYEKGINCAPPAYEE